MTDKILVDRSVIEQALDALCNTETVSGEQCDVEYHAIMALRAALEQPQVEQEPVAWIERWYGSGPERGWWIVCGRDHIAHLGPAEMSGEAASKIVSAHNTSPPAQRQPLTDEWIRMIYDECDAETGDEFIFAFARAIERAHGIVGE